MNAFHSFIKNCGLFDFGFSGPAYTWLISGFLSWAKFWKIR
jgi:hypothetical protein